jgi:transcriptional regulator with XRE-family HTH domain
MVCHISDMAIGETIRAARVRAGLTQRYVAKTLDVGASAVNQWESGTTKPSITNRARLAVLLNISLMDLIPGAPVDEVAEAIAQLVRSVPRSKQVGFVATLEQVVRLMAEQAPDAESSPPTKPKRGK